MSVPRSRTTDRRYYGVFEGIVTQVGDDLQEGMIKVNLPWLDSHSESDWSPIVQFMAGPGHGAFFVPEVGSLVLCAARHGDLRKLVILGGLYNGQDKPPVGHERQRHIQTPSGQMLGFLDVNNNTEGGVFLEDSAGDRVSLSSSGTVTVKAQGALILDAPAIVLRGPGYRRVVANNGNTI
jgi:uncharacterized protein involved in type VI secretion and phage assembly